MSNILTICYFLISCLNRVNLLVSPTEENGKILASFANIPIGGTPDLTTAIQIAQLALKHRKNKNGGQRIIAFVGSPIPEKNAVLVKIGKGLKKNGVAIDIICVGEFEENSEKLTELVNAANSNDNSHLIIVQPGVSPANAIMSSPLMYSSAFASAAMAGSEGGGGGGSGGGDMDMYGGIDPSMDPELAMAIRISAEEARAAEEAGNKVAIDNSVDASLANATDLRDPQGTDMSAIGSPGSAVPFAGFGGAGALDEDDEEALMQRALEMSMREMTTTENDVRAGENSGAVGNDQEEDIDEEEELRRALALSTGTDTSSAAPVATTAGDSFVDPDFVSQLLGGADQTDPLIQAAMQQLQQQQHSGGDSAGKDDESGVNKKRKNDDEK